MAGAEGTAQAEIPDDPLLLPHEVAERFGVGSATVKRWVRERRLPALRTLGGHHRFRRSDVDALVGEDGGMSEQTGGVDDRVVVVTPDGGPGGEQSPVELVEQPAKVMRIGSMIKQLLEEVRGAPLDEAGRARLMEIHRRSIIELEQGLSPELVAELERITLPFGDQTPTDAELRIAQAQLVGWLEGLFHGIQTALVAQQMAARMQLEGMRHQLPPGMSPGPGPGPGLDGPESPGPRNTGQYL